MKSIQKYLLFCTAALLFACGGKSGQQPTKSCLRAIGTVVSGSDLKATMIYQDHRNDYWFVSGGKGVYRYDGQSLVLYTTADGLCSTAVVAIQEDKHGNIYFDTTDGVCQFDGEKFSTLAVADTVKEPEKWTSQPDDLWFRMGWDSDGPFRFDGEKLHHLVFPKNKMEAEFYAKYPNVSFNPYGIYDLYKDSKGGLWFGTSSLGLYYFDGKTVRWMYEHELTETPQGGAFGIRSVIEDQQGYFWICNPTYKYKVLPADTASSGLQPLNYTREPGVSHPKVKDMYFMSMAQSDNGDLWMMTNDDGVWRNTGKEFIHYPVKDGERNVPLYSIYKDHQGVLWLGTQGEAVYRYDGGSFVPFNIK